MQTQAYNLNPEFADFDQLISALEAKWSEDRVNDDSDIHWAEGEEEQFEADQREMLECEIANSRYYDLCIENLDGASGFC